LQLAVGLFVTQMLLLLHQESSLYYAALKGRHDMVRILIKHGADVNDIDEEGVSEYDYY